MSANLDLLKKGYEDFIAGDVQAAVAPWSDDFTWQGVNAEGLPGAGTHEGKQAAIQALQRAVGAWDHFELSADEFVDGGDTIVVLGHSVATKGENTAKGPFVHVWRFRGGQPVRIQVLADTLLLARALGVA